MWTEYIRGNRTGSMTKGREATGTSTLDPVLETGSATRAGVRGVVNHMIGAAKRIPDVYARNVETQKAVNEKLGESGPMAELDRRLRDFQTTRQEQRLARQTSPEANKNTVRKTLAVVGETIRAGLDSFGVGTVGEEYSEPKTTEQKISLAPPPTEEDYARDKARREAEAQQNQPSMSEQTSPTEQEQYAGEEATLARLQTEIAALTDEKIQEINAAESATDAVFAKGMADIAVQSKIAHEIILPYSAEGIAQLETMRSNALATLQQALDARNRGAKPTTTPSQELTQSVANAEHTPTLVSTSEQTPQAPTGFEAQVSELTDRTAQEIMASGSAMDAIRMKGEAASAVLSMTAHELMQPHLSREDAAQLKDTRDRSLAALQAALNVRLESPDSNEATSVAAESQPLAEAAQTPEATTAEPTHEEVDGSVEENRAAAIKAATEVEGEKKDRLIHRAQTALHMAQKAIWAVKDWFSQKVPDPKPTPNLPLKDHSFTKASNGEAQEQPVAVDTEAQATQPHVPSHETPAGGTEEDLFALARAAGVLRGNSDPGEPVVTSYDEATHRGEGEPEAKLAEVINFPAGAEQPPADDEAPTEELETVAEAIDTQEDAPLSRDKMRQMEQMARSKIQLGEYDLWAEMTKADANNEEVDIDELIKNTRTAIQENVRGWLQEEGRQHQASGLYLSTLEARTMESADSALESIKQAYIKAKQARESRQDSAA